MSGKQQSEWKRPQGFKDYHWAYQWLIRYADWINGCCAGGYVEDGHYIVACQRCGRLMP